MNRRELMQGIIVSTIASRMSSTQPFNGNELSAGVRHIHPCLYLTPPTLAHLKERFRVDNIWANSLLADGNSMLKSELIQEIDATGAKIPSIELTQSRRFSRMSLTLGLLYQITGEERFANKLLATIRQFADCPRWEDKSYLRRLPPWHSELNTGEICFGVANGYDALRHYLSAEQSREIRDVILRLGILPTLDDWILPGTRFHSFDSMGHNWWSACVGAAGVAILSIYNEDERASNWIDAIDQAFEQWYTFGGNRLHNHIATFEAGGGPSYEGVTYARFAVTNHLRYLIAWQNRFGERKATVTRHLVGLPEFFLHTLYPASTRNLLVNFDDYHSNETAEDCVLMLQACGIDDEYGRLYLHYQHSEFGDRLATYLPSSKHEPSFALAKSKVYPTIGWAMMRNSWKEDATLLAAKSGYTWNHAHADASTFMLMHKGSSIVIDSGTCEYSRREYASYYRQSIAHNVILYDGKGQPPEQFGTGTKFPGSIFRWFDGLELRYAGADATGPLADRVKRNYRHFIWISNVILIVDDIATYHDARLDWLLHTGGSARREDNQTLRVWNGNASAGIRLLYPVDAALEERDGLSPENPDEHVTYHAFQFDTREMQQRVITAIDLNLLASPKMEVREFESYLQITVSSLEEIHHLYLNLRSINGAHDMSSTIQIGDWVTDAYLLGLTHATHTTNSPPRISRFLVLDGSFVRYGREPVLESLSKINCLWNQAASMEVFTQGQACTHVALSTENRPSRLQWNGVETQVDYEPSERVVHLRSSPGI